MTLKNRITKTKKGLLAWHQERTIFETTNLMCKVMDESRISRAELARRMNTSKGYITQLLDGSTNMTLRTVSDVFVALGREFHPGESPIERSPTHTETMFAIDAPAFSSSDTVVLHATSTPAVAG